MFELQDRQPAVATFGTALLDDTATFPFDLVTFNVPLPYDVEFTQFSLSANGALAAAKKQVTIVANGVATVFNELVSTIDVDVSYPQSMRVGPVTASAQSVTVSVQGGLATGEQLAIFLQLNYLSPSAVP